MTRGRKSNVAYVALDQPDDSHQAPEDADITARSVLYGVLQHTGADRSAHQTVKLERETYGGIAQSAAERESIAADAQHDRFAGILARSGLTKAQHDAVIGSTAFGPLTATLRRAEASYHDLRRLLPRVIARHGLDVDDIAAVLTYRTNKTAIAPRRGMRNAKPRLIVGLIPDPLA